MLYNARTQQDAPLPKVDYDLPRDKSLWNGVFLVGEAPGRDEVKMGRPFVGRSGKLLDEALKEANIERNQCLVANVFRFQPPNNKIDHFFRSRRAASAQNIRLADHLGPFNNAWCSLDYASEVNSLEGLLHEWAPLLVIALGRTPLWALTGENGLLSKVGKLLGCRLYKDAMVMPTYHPSYILRGNWAKKPEWVGHFHAALHYVTQK